MVEFSRQGYAKVVSAFMDRHYQFVCFHELPELAANSDRYCLLRHDVDVSMEFALRMAQLEAELGVKSTFFVMFRSPLYNLMSRHSSGALREIVRLGHEIGLHFDASYSQGAEKTLDEWIAFELSTLEALSGARVSAFSLHQPTPELIASEVELIGITNTYHPRHLEGFKYVSDSNRKWRDKDPFQLVSAGVERIQFLAHPVWWISEYEDIQDCWDHAIRTNFDISQQQLLSTERAYSYPRRLLLQR